MSNTINQLIINSSYETPRQYLGAKVNVVKKVSNHYVPQFYLKNFSNNKKSIGMYIIDKRKYCKEASIKEQACKDYLYGKDTKLEDMFMDIEREVSKIINDIIDTSSIPLRNSAEYALLLLFMLISETRNLKTADSYNNFIDISMKTLAKMDRRCNISHDILDRVKISMKIPNLTSIKVAHDIYPILFDLKCVLLINKTDRQFITSDNSLVKYNQMYVERRYTSRGYGLGNMGIQLFFPITPQLCICLFDHCIYDYKANMDENIEINKEGQIDEVNKLFFLNTYNSLYFNDKTKESYINRLVSSIEHSNSELDKEIAIFGTENDKLIAYSPKKVKERINMTFFIIRQKFMEMLLPANMAGPIRPYAEKFCEELKRQ